MAQECRDGDRKPRQECKGEVKRGGKNPGGRNGAAAAVAREMQGAGKQKREAVVVRAQHQFGGGEEEDPVEAARLLERTEKEADRAQADKEGPGVHAAFLRMVDGKLGGAKQRGGKQGGAGGEEPPDERKEDRYGEEPEQNGEEAVLDLPKAEELEPEPVGEAVERRMDGVGDEDAHHGWEGFAGG